MRLERFKTILQYLGMWSLASAFLLLITHTNKVSQTETKDSREESTWPPDCEPFRLKQRLPVGLLIGAQNAGSSAILEHLQRDPRFKVAFDIHFFDNDETYKGERRIYRSLMPSSCKTDIVLEATSGYLSADDAIERVREYNQSVRLLVVLRDPIDRALADFRETIGGEEADFEALAMDTNETVNAELGPISRSEYGKRLRQWMDVFPLRQWHFVDFSSFLIDPVTELNSIVAFFGLTPRFKNSSIPTPWSSGCSKRDCELSIGNALTTSVNQALLKFYAPQVKEVFDLVNQKMDWMKKYLD